MSRITGERRAFARGVLAGMLLMVSATAVNWLITPASHPDASTARTTAVVVQMLLPLGLAAWLYLREKRTWRTAPQRPG